MATWLRAHDGTMINLDKMECIGIENGWVKAWTPDGSVHKIAEFDCDDAARAALNTIGNDLLRSNEKKEAHE